MAKVITDKMSAKIASEDGGRWDAVAVNPCVVLGAKNAFLSHLYTKLIILPRQARDKT